MILGVDSVNENVTNKNQNELLNKEKKIIKMIIEYDKKTKAD